MAPVIFPLPIDDTSAVLPQGLTRQWGIAGSWGISTGFRECNPSLLWHWNMMDECFIGLDWNVQSKVQYAGTIIGVVVLTFTLELFRRLSRGYDGRLVRNNSDAAKYRPSFLEQTVRAFLFTLQVVNAYTLILIAVSFNGGVIIAIFVATFFAFWALGWEYLPCNPGSGGKS
ncbi:Ctr copper transporter family-domain-containing protein [Podospora appendiculata]|uniref:Copper transport protein n=1 Tax=Podospora appendiculata TaxID=314037 RepID=A0AAE0XJX0_9PEZI|nr:Ctr copper transporter family-domain-containing protein [Podospora appendiculata]